MKIILSRVYVLTTARHNLKTPANGRTTVPPVVKFAIYSRAPGAPCCGLIYHCPNFQTTNSTDLPKRESQPLLDHRHRPPITQQRRGVRRPSEYGLSKIGWPLAPPRVIQRRPSKQRSGRGSTAKSARHSARDSCSARCSEERE